MRREREREGREAGVEWGKEKPAPLSAPRLFGVRRQQKKTHNVIKMEALFGVCTVCRLSARLLGLRCVSGASRVKTLAGKQKSPLRSSA